MWFMVQIYVRIDFFFLSCVDELLIYKILGCSLNVYLFLIFINKSLL